MTQYIRHWIKMCPEDKQDQISLLRQMSKYFYLLIFCKNVNTKIFRTKMTSYIMSRWPRNHHVLTEHVEILGSGRQWFVIRKERGWNHHISFYMISRVNNSFNPLSFNWKSHGYWKGIVWETSANHQTQVNLLFQPYIRLDVMYIYI